MKARKYEYTGSILGLLGAALLAMNISVSEWGWVVFLVSNMSFIKFSMANRLRGVLLMNVGFTATSVMGIVRGFNLGP